MLTLKKRVENLEARCPAPPPPPDLGRLSAADRDWYERVCIRCAAVGQAAVLATMDDGELRRTLAVAEILER